MSYRHFSGWDCRVKIDFEEQEGGQGWVKVKAPTDVRKTASADESEALDPFGAGIPFADPGWYQSVRRRAPSPAYMCGVAS